MGTLGLLFLIILVAMAQAQTEYTPRPYDQYDRDRPYNQSQYGDPNNPYNRDQNSGNRDYNSQYPGNRDSTYFGTRDPNNRDQYFTNQNSGNRDQYPGYRDQYPGNRDQYPGNRDQNPGNRDQYSGNQYPGNRDQYPGNRDQYPGNRDQYPGNRDQYPGNRDQYPGNRDQYPGNRDQYPGNRDQYPGNRDQYPGNRDQYPGNRNQYPGNRDQYPGSTQYPGDRNQYPGDGNRNFGNNAGYGDEQYGSPLFDKNDNCCREYCYTQDANPYLHFATKTAYQVVYDKRPNQQYSVPDCTPVQFWSINRHGTRYPTSQTLDRLRQLIKIQQDIIRNYDERRSYPDKGRLCASDLDLIRRWRWNDTIPQRADTLTSQGMDDLKYLARRYASRFDLLKQPYEERTYMFQYTDTDRTHDSYQAYIEGLFKQDAYKVHANMFNSDRLIKPSDNCRAWKYNVDENPRTLEEYMKFKRSPDYQQMVRDVFRRLGFRYSLDEKVIKDMYDMCRYEKAWNLGEKSPWCMVFNKEQLKLLEYAEDLKYFYKSGYGNQLSSRIGCPPVKDLFEKFDRTVNGNSNDNKVTVLFTHSLTIQTFLTAMGIARDDQPLRADNYFQQQQRQWRTSVIDPFAANLAAVLYQCRSGETSRVMFLLNESPVNLPECSVGLCNWSTIKMKLQNIAGNCNMEFCDQSSAAALKKNYITYLLSLVAIFIVFRQ